MSDWLADRTRFVRRLRNPQGFRPWGEAAKPINLSIGQPDFEPPEEVRRAAVEAIENRKNGYTATQGIPATSGKIARAGENMNMGTPTAICLLPRAPAAG